jgi:hypothetical protein
MSISNPKLHVEIKQTEIEFDRVEGQVAAIMAVTATLALVTYLVLLQALL